MPSLVHQVGGGMLLIRAARGRQRLTVGRYLFSNLMTRVTGRPAAAGDMTLTLSELQVTVGTFSAQLGSYLDIFSRRIYEKLPGFLGRSGQIIVDAGANVGFYTLRQAKAVGPSGHVYAVEPNPDSYSRLERNVAQNGLAWVTCIPKGLSSEEGTMVLDADPRETSTATAHRIESASRLPLRGRDHAGRPRRGLCHSAYRCAQDGYGGGRSGDSGRWTSSRTTHHAAGGDGVA